MGGAMLKLNHELLSLPGIIATFKKTVMDGVRPTNPKTPSLLNQLRERLRTTYFDKNTTNENVFVLLKEMRFNEFPELRQALMLIFSQDDSAAIEPTLKAIRQTDKAQQSTEMWRKLTHEYGYFNNTTHPPDYSPIWLNVAISCTN